MPRNRSSSFHETLGSEVSEEMQSEKAVQYRLQYQKFRRGEARGRGEEPAEASDGAPRIDDEGDPHSACPRS